MKIEELKKKLEPWIREIIRDESERNTARKLQDARKALELLGGFGLGVKANKNGLNVEWEEER